MTARLSSPPTPLAGRPGYQPARLLRLMHEAMRDCDLDLSGRRVLTEAATGAYVVTPVIAALAGASQVVAVTRSTRYGTVAAVREETMTLARAAGVDDRIEIVEGKRAEHLAQADVVTNSGHLRPLDASDVGLMRPTAVVPLMFEAWEIQAGRVDIDLEALLQRGIATAGTNERHPHVDVFSYLGTMAVWQLLTAGVSVYRSHVVVVCDNPFAEYLVRGLRNAGAVVQAGGSLEQVLATGLPDAILVAQTPRGRPVVDKEAAQEIAQRWPGATLVQYWGDLDRESLRQAGVPVWPPLGPPPGHMAVLPSDIGPDAVVRLQTGGLKVAEVLLKPAHARTAEEREYLDEL